MGKKRTEIAPWDSLQEMLYTSDSFLASEVSFFAQLTN